MLSCDWLNNRASLSRPIRDNQISDNETVMWLHAFSRAVQVDFHCCHFLDQSEVIRNLTTKLRCGCTRFPALCRSWLYFDLSRNWFTGFLAAVVIDQIYIYIYIYMLLVFRRTTCGPLCYNS